MAQGTRGEGPTCNILNFIYDDSDGCALTVLINGIRFHIIVDADEVRRHKDSDLWWSYKEHIEAVKSKDEDDRENITPSHRLDEGDKSGRDRDEEQERPRSVTSETKSDHDSAVDMSDDRRRLRSAEKDADAEETPDAEKSLQNWILSMFAEETERLFPTQKERSKRTLHAWYNGTTRFFEFKADGKSLIPEELKETADLKQRIYALIPRVPLPKYLRNTNVPWRNSADIEVLSEINFPEPAHPGDVQVADEIQFFKPVDPTQPQAMKRELKLLKQIDDLGLSDKIRVPKLLGLVGFENSKTEIMGYLLTKIPSPQPLTTLLSSETSEDRRLKWADESKDIVQTLHKHKIIWGDAKADNFMVDENDDLWIIDFGGSYTEGWVDPELAETKEGDCMGLDKIVNALVDPDENTFLPGEEEESEYGDDGDYIPTGEKRRRDSKEERENEDGEDRRQSTKRRKPR